MAFVLVELDVTTHEDCVVLLPGLKDSHQAQNTLPIAVLLALYSPGLLNRLEHLALAVRELHQARNVVILNLHFDWVHINSQAGALVSLKSRSHCEVAEQVVVNVLLSIH